MALVLLLLAVVFAVHRGAFEQPELKQAVLLAALPLLLLPSACAGSLRRAANVGLPLPILALALLFGWTTWRAAWIGWDAPAITACAVSFAGLLAVVAAWGESFDRPLALPTTMLGAGLVASGVAILQCAGFDPIFGGMPDAARRALSFFGNTNSTGQFVAPLVVLAVALARVPRERAALLRSLALAAIAPLAATLILTQSRAALLAAIVGLLVSFALERRDAAAGGPPPSRIVPNVLLAIGVVIALVVGGTGSLSFKALDEAPQSIASPEYPTNKQRLALARATVEMVKDAPYVGRGPGRFARDFPPYRDPDEARIPTLLGARSVAEDPHDQYLLLLAEGGGVALLLFLAFALPTLLATARAVVVRADDPRRAIAHANGAAFTALLVLALFRSILADPPTALVFFLLAGQLLPLRDDAGESRPSRLAANLLPIAMIGLLALGGAHAFSQFALASPARAAIERAARNSGESRSLEEADRWLARAESADPGAFDVKQVRATVLDALAQRSGAANAERASIRERMLRLRPWHVPSLAALAAIHIDGDRFDAARLLLARALRAQSGRGGRRAYDARAAADLLLELGHEAQAGKLIAAEAADGRVARDLPLTMIRDDKTPPALALALLATVPPGGPGDGDSAYAAAGRAQAAGDEELAQRLFRRAHLSFAIEHLAARRFEDADRSARLARRRIPSAEADVLLALSRIARNDPDAAIQLDAALKAAPDGLDPQFLSALDPLAGMAELKDALAKVLR